MSEVWRKPMTRRVLLKSAASIGLGAAAAACAPPGTTSGSSGTKGKRTLRILQWSHFVPDYDTWFDKFVADWGVKNNVDASVDHISTDDIPARMAAEVASKSGHDLIEMNGLILTYLYQKQLADMGDIVDYAVKKWGEVEPFGKRQSFVGDRWVGFPSYMIAILPIVRTDLLQQAGYDWKTLKSWDQYLEAGAKLKSMGHASGFAISHCNDSDHNWRCMMWAFGASEVAKDGKTLTVDTPEMRSFLKFAQEFHARANTPDVFAWDNTSDNKWLASGTGGFIHDAISSLRSIQGPNPDLYSKAELSAPIVGPAAPNGITAPDCNVYVMWNWAPKQNQDAAKEFLRYWVDNMEEAFKQSKLYNQPTFSGRYGKGIFSSDPKVKALEDYHGPTLSGWGYPGGPTYEASLVRANWVIPDTIAAAVNTKGDAGINAAIKFLGDQTKRYYATAK